MLLLLACAARTVPDAEPTSPLTALRCDAAPAEGEAAPTDEAFRAEVVKRGTPGVTADPSRRVIVAPGPAFAISVTGKERVLAVDDVPDALPAYLAAGAPWGDACLGLWLSDPDGAGPDPGSIYLDQSVLWAYDPDDRTAAREAALVIARAQAQKAIWDFGKNEEIEVPQ